MGTWGQLRRIESQLIKDLEKTTIAFLRLGEKYGVSRQAIFAFGRKRGIKRPKREHIKECPICQGLIRIAKKPHSDFISSQTIKKELGVGNTDIGYHVRILRKKGLIAQKFGRLRSIKSEWAYQIYFEKRLPVGSIGKQVGLKNFNSIIRKHKASGWDVPDPLFKYDRNERGIRLKMLRKGEGGVAMDKNTRSGSDPFGVD
jgi:biotin operon repressor